MEYKERYRFFLFGPIVFMMWFFDILVLIGIVCIVAYGLMNDGTDWIVGLIFVSIILFCLLWATLQLCLYATIDKDKIEMRGYKGVLVSFRIDEITRIEKKPAMKGDLYFGIFGVEKKYRKTLLFRGSVVSMLATPKTEKVLRHFIPESKFE